MNNNKICIFVCPWYVRCCDNIDIDLDNNLAGEPKIMRLPEVLGDIRDIGYLVYYMHWSLFFSIDRPMGGFLSNSDLRISYFMGSIITIWRDRLDLHYTVFPFFRLNDSLNVYMRKNIIENVRLQIQCTFIQSSRTSEFLHVQCLHVFLFFLSNRI